MRQALQFGASSFLVKPFNMDQLVLGLEQLLSSQFRLLLKERERLETEGQMMLASITALAEALEARDPYTRGHSDAVAEIAVGIARCMGLEEQELDNLRIGGRLHDIGKIGVPDDILLKPGRLTDEEFAVIKRHPTVGAGILAPIPSLAEVLPVVEQHHEHFDGNGYPRGLAGESISLNARITGVADCYDALTSDRPYRQGMSHEEALAIIRQLRGSQLCPDCVDAFIGWTGRIADFGRRHLRAFG
jgi:putative nucleotidyltransferase with HDIG domain